MIVKAFSATIDGVSGRVIEIQAARQCGGPIVVITGLPNDVVKESRDRVRACLEHLGFEVPRSRVLIHLSPACGKKEGSQFDLPIALALLAIDGYLPASVLSHRAFLGELGLDGRIHPIQGALAFTHALEKKEFVSEIILPKKNAAEVTILESRKARVASNLKQVLDHLKGKQALDGIDLITIHPSGSIRYAPPLDIVKGQHSAKRALQVSLAGFHHLLFLGPPGVGKSLLASCIPGLLSPLGREEAITVTRLYEMSSVTRSDLFERPFRAPHHSVSISGLLGGGSGMIIPGEVSLSHRGVLFLDELPEFRRDIIDGLREPLQEGTIQISRVGKTHRLEADFLLVAAMNPCPCGNSLSSSRRCYCSWERKAAYRRKVSSAILDRIDLGVVFHEPKEETASPLSHDQMQSELIQAWEIQSARNPEGRLNGRSFESFETLVSYLDCSAGKRLEEWKAKGTLSYRALGKLLRVGRTIADLEKSLTIKRHHLEEAWLLRCPELHSLGT